MDNRSAEDERAIAVLRDRHERVLAHLRDLAAAHGHDPTALRIVGVTKAHPFETARTAVAAGITRLGESRVQEAEPKVADLPEAEWHFIGRIQSNKARRVVRAFSAIHSVDSIELLARLHALCDEEDRRAQLLLQFNVTGEPSKAGLRPDALLEPRTVATVRDAAPVGLMTIAPMGATHEEARRVFGRLRELRDQLQQEAGIRLPELSMGMSADAEAAVAEGATLVRIGEALFGPRASSLLSSRA